MPSFLSEVETGILSQIATLSTASFSMATAARPAFITGLVIWITLTGYEVAFGKTQDSVAYLLTKLGKMVLIGVLALFAWPSVAELLSGLKDAAIAGSGGAGAASQIEASVIYPMAALWLRMYQWVTIRHSGRL
jgi:type IV secretion system protein VirB6